ncbi:MAG TPA: CDP-alcohol phosphatidyltransferase family protein [Terriglobales bacterium]|nr:CDP-alcohol phosphatidyltransferase family protein [Terriglobales bacterium]
MSSKAPIYRILGSSTVQLWSLDNGERLHRLMRRAGLRPATADDSGTSYLLIRADHVYEESVIKALIRQPRQVLITEDGQPVAAHLLSGGDIAGAEQMLQTPQRPTVAGLPRGLEAISDPAELATTYNHALRKRAKPYVLPLTPETAPAIEKRMFDGAYKGVTDFVTKYVWPFPAMLLTRWCARRGITPNTVTSISFLFMLLAMWLFWSGYFLLGLAFAWGMCFLDTVDGKLARVTLTSSKFGNAFDHGIDLIHPPFWYYAWYVGQGGGLAEGMSGTLQSVALWIILVGYVLGRLQEGLFIWLYQIEIHTWRPIDSWFRLITARRNPNLAILTIAALLNQPVAGFIAVAIWTVLSFIFHCWRIAQAASRQSGGHRLESWLTEPMAEVPST